MKLLEGVTVVEVGKDPAGRYCGRIFALSGARVERFAERSSASPGARHQRYVEAYLDQHKDVREYSQPVGAADSRLLASLGVADVLIAGSEFAWDTVPEGLRPPVSGTVNDFAPTGRRAGWVGTEAVLSAVGGAANYTRTHDGQPVYGFGRRFQYLAGQYLFIALTAAVMGPTRARTFPMVRVSAAETVAALLPYATTQYAYNGTTTTIEQSGPRFLCACRDGFLCVYAGGRWADLAQLLGDSVRGLDDCFAELGRRFGNAAHLETLVIEWCATRTLAEAIAKADACSVAVAAAYTVEDVLSDESLRRNGTLNDVNFAGTMAVAPGLPYRAEG